PASCLPSLSPSRTNPPRPHTYPLSLHDALPISDVVFLERPRRDLQQHRAHAVPPPTDRAPRCDPGRLVHPAVLHRRDRWAAGLGHESRPRARVHLLGGRLPCCTTCVVPPCRSNGSSPACSLRSPCATCSAP